MLTIIGYLAFGATFGFFHAAAQDLFRWARKRVALWRTKRRLMNYARMPDKQLHETLIKQCWLLWDNKDPSVVIYKRGEETLTITTTLYEVTVCDGRTGEPVVQPARYHPRKA